MEQYEILHKKTATSVWRSIQIDVCRTCQGSWKKPFLLAAVGMTNMIMNPAGLAAVTEW